MSFDAAYEALTDHDDLGGVDRPPSVAVDVADAAARQVGRHRVRVRLVRPRKLRRIGARYQIPESWVSTSISRRSSPE